MAVFRVEKVRDYTVVSNAVFKDRTLSAKAKGILVEMLSLPEDWDYTLEGLASLFADGLDSIRKGVHELEEHGYIVRRRVRNEKGQLGASEYTIYETPQDVEKSVEKSCKTHRKSVEKPSETTESDDSGIPSFAYPVQDSPTEENPTQASPAQENPVTYKIHNPLNTNESITNPSNPNLSLQPDRIRETNAIPMDRMGYDEAKEKFRENIEYEIMCERYPTERIDEIVEIAAEALCSGKKTFKIGDDIYPYSLVKSRLLSMTGSSLGYLMDSLNSNTTQIRSIKKYLLQSIINASATAENHCAAQVNHDMYGSPEKW